jgi:hypothetical protein
MQPDPMLIEKQRQEEMKRRQMVNMMKVGVKQLIYEEQKTRRIDENEARRNGRRRKENDGNGKTRRVG